MKRRKITTIGKDLKKHECEYEIHTRYDRHNKFHKVELRLFMKGDENSKWFDFKLAPIGDDTLKVTDMFVGKESHRKKGIPEALIMESKKLFGNKIISSSDKHPILISEWRREVASKVWDRLVKKGLAEYNSKFDFYFLIQ